MLDPPRRKLSARRAHYPLANLDDDSGFLGNRNEVERRDEPELGVMPAEKRFDSDDSTRRYVDDWLIVERKLFIAQGMANVAFQHESTRCSLMNLGVED